MIFGISRNIETSLYDYLKDNLEYYNYRDVSVVKSLADSEIKALPFIVVELTDTTHLPLEIGSTSTYRSFNLFIDVYHTNRGSMIDLKDFIVSMLKEGFPVYNYTIANGRLLSKVYDGRINVKTNIRDYFVNANVEISNLHENERFRHRITCNCIYNKAEISSFVPSEEVVMETIKTEKMAGENLGAYSFVSLLPDELLYLSNNTSFDLASTIGMVSGNYLRGQMANVILFGEVQNLAWNFVTGKVVYLDGDNQLTQDIPALVGGTSYIIKVGQAIGDNKLLVKPELDVIGVV